MSVLEKAVTNAVHIAISTHMTEQEYEQSVDVAAKITWLTAYLPDHVNFIKRAVSLTSTQQVVDLMFTKEEFAKLSKNKQREVVKAIQEEKRMVAIFSESLLNLLRRLDNQVEAINNRKVNEAIDNLGKQQPTNK